VVALTVLVAAACKPGQQSELRPRAEAAGYPGVRVVTTQSCTYRLDGPTSGWVALAAEGVTPAAAIAIRDATVIGLSGPHLWRDPIDQVTTTPTPQAYELWDGEALPEVRTVAVAPGETFRVRYAVTAVDGGRTVPAGDERVGVRVLAEDGTALTMLQQGCDGGTASVSGGMAPVLTGIDWAAGQAALNAAVADGLVLGVPWQNEFVRVLEEPCGTPWGSMQLPDPIEDVVMLEVDHGAPVTVGVIGDSITSQIRDELVHDTRYNWVIGSMCAARIDHFLGPPVLPTLTDLSFATEAVLAADPDVVLMALGTADTMHRPGVDHAGNIDALMSRFDDVQCALWMNLHVGDHPDQVWREDATAFDADVLTVAAAHHVPVIDWHTVTRAAGTGMSHPWLLPGPIDLMHVSVTLGHRARVGMTLEAIESCPT
jgi:hypothetical protein